jgi:hypothetical protein
MKQIFLITLMLILSAFITMPAAGQEGKGENDSGNGETSISQAEDRTYSAEEVDKQAEIKNLDEASNEFTSKFECDKEGSIIYRIVLHKSGKVTDVKVETTTGCNITEEMIAGFRKLKFTPAKKNGKPVSQLFEMEERRTLYTVPNP